MSIAPRQLGFWTAVALVVGNMIGSGLFLLPAALAPYGSGSLLGWAISGVGAVLLALVFARLGLMLPQTGGPYVFARAAFGDATGFLVAWGYWIAVWCGNAAIAIAFAGAMQKLLPYPSPRAALVIALAAIWTCTAFNLRGVTMAGRVQLVSTVLKLAPLAVLIVFGTLSYSLAPTDVPPLQPDPSMPLWQIAQQTAALTLWAFLGLESATIAAGAMRDPARTVPIATLLGTAIAVIVTVAACVVAMVLVPAATLAQSGAPFVDAASRLWGERTGLMFAAAAAIAAFGTLNGWVLMQGQIALATAQDGLFPRAFAVIDARGTPWFGLLTGSVLASLLVMANFNAQLVQVFTFATLLSTAATLVPYVLCAAALLRLTTRRSAGITLVCVLALVYSLWALWGTGAQTLAWGGVLFACGLPVYIAMRLRRRAVAHT